MKRKDFSRKGAAVFTMAAFLLVVGSACIFSVFRQFDSAVYQSGVHQELMRIMHRNVWTLMLGMGLVTTGVITELILFAHMLRRTARLQREAAALQKKNEQMQALNAQIRELNHHQRLQLMGTLTSSIAHEFNNLLTPIMGYSLMALEKLDPEEEELYDSLVEVYNASKEAKTLITRLNDLSRKQSDSSFRQVSLDEIVSHAMKVAAPAKPKPVQLQISLNCWGQQIRGNYIQLSQLVLNLVLNSFQAMESGGQLRIETNFDEHWAYLRVSDTGCGIAREHMSKIFEPFFTTKESGKGTGLGLAIAAQTVEDHRGKISVDSRLGEGTTVTVQLPRI